MHHFFLPIFRWFEVLSRFPKVASSTSRGNKSRTKNGIKPFKESPTALNALNDMNSCEKKETDQPVLWLCFATRLGLKHFAKETNQDTLENKALPLNKNDYNLMNSSQQQVSHLSNNNNKNQKDKNKSTLSCSQSSPSSVNQSSQEDQNWINSNSNFNPGKTSSSTSSTTTSITCLKEDFEKKLAHTREELKKINKELRESYANYDHLEVRTS